MGKCPNFGANVWMKNQSYGEEATKHNVCVREVAGFSAFIVCVTDGDLW